MLFLFLLFVFYHSLFLRDLNKRPQKKKYGLPYFVFLVSIIILSEKKTMTFLDMHGSYAISLLSSQVL